MKTCDEQLTSIEYKKGFIGVSIYCFLKICFRDMMMYDPAALTPDVWAKYTRALTDCNSKTENYQVERLKIENLKIIKWKNGRSPIPFPGS